LLKITDYLINYLNKMAELFIKDSAEQATGGNLPW
jgi:hypothetical protein